MIQWHTQAGNININLKFKLYFTLPARSATNFVTCKCYVNDSAKGRYNIIFRPYLLTEKGLYLKFSEHVIEASYGNVKVSTTPMLDLGTYKFKYLNTG